MLLHINTIESAKMNADQNGEGKGEGCGEKEKKKKGKKEEENIAVIYLLSNAYKNKTISERL